VGTNPPLQLVAGATYKPLGPLSGLALGNGSTEIRSFDARYFPAGIQVPGRLGWSYSTDAVGNILSITDTLNAANNRTYGYQDSQYFLTSGNGPWGARSWTYDRIGNRLTETRGAITDTYTYLSNGTGGNTPKIDQFIPRVGPAGRYTFDDTGNVLEDGRLSFSYGDDKRLTYSGDPKGGTTYTYDGRGFLSQSTLPLSTGLYDDYTVPTYSSEGLLHHSFAHRNLLSGTRVSSVQKSHLFVFYFTGRPVATLDKVTEGPPNVETTTSTWQYLTVDHLGTPILVTNPAGTQLWQGGFEPFGADYNSSPTILRFPGQWDDTTFSRNEASGLFYNVNRWYAPTAGRYTQPDPLGLSALNPIGPRHLYSYGEGQPTNNVDSLGLYSMDPSCNKWCGPPSIGQCSNSAAGQCVFPLLDDIRHRVFRNQACRRALETAGLWRVTAGALMPTSEYPVITCREGDCEGPGSSRGRYFAFSRSIPICSNYFVLRWELGAQTLFHEILHSIGLGHDEMERNILRTCYPGFEP
jgi:RHS repeat-associated protein